MVTSRSLHSDVTLGHFRIRPFGRCSVGGQKCIAVIERKTLIVSLFTNASDYSSETTIFVRYKHIDLSVQVLLEYSLVLMNNDTFSAFLSITAIHF